MQDHLSFFLCTSTSTSIPCTAHFHLRCLASQFLSPTSSSLPLSAAPPSTLATPLLPTHGCCPSCRQPLHWSDLVRGSYRRKEEVEGTRKKRRFEKGTRAKELALLRGDEDDEDVENADRPTKGRKKRAKSKGKGKEVALESEDEESVGEPSGGEEEEQERSWARLTAAEGALEDVGEASEETENEQASTSIFTKRKKPTQKPSAQSTGPATKLGRRSGKAPTAAPRSLLSSTLTSTKSSLSSTKSKTPAGPSRSSQLTADESDDLPDPSTLGFRPPPIAEQKRKKEKKDKIEYIEVSD